MPAMYFLPKEDITSQETALIMGFVAFGLVDNIEQRANEVRNNLKEDYPIIRQADRSMNPNKTIIVHEGLYDLLPPNLKRHFSAF